MRKNCKWYHFWNPYSGAVGGLVFLIVLVSGYWAMDSVDALFEWVKL